jgi:uncharacterized protein YPO0396
MTHNELVKKRFYLKLERHPEWKSAFRMYAMRIDNASRSGDQKEVLRLVALRNQLQQMLTKEWSRNATGANKN